uniref:Uncharacterized protein n=1 Tax=Triticum urartu TaxID=4572 RepID=A0A8R7QBR2_TRIUA
ARSRFCTSVLASRHGAESSAQGHQAKQHHARRLLHRQVRRLRARKAHQRRPEIAHDRHSRHHGVHGSGVRASWQGERRVRHVQLWGGPPRGGLWTTTGFGQDDGDVIHLVQWVWDLYGRGKALSAADARLKE